MRLSLFVCVCVVYCGTTNAQFKLLFELYCLFLLVHIIFVQCGLMRVRKTWKLWSCCLDFKSLLRLDLRLWDYLLQFINIDIQHIHMVQIVNMCIFSSHRNRNKETKWVFKKRILIINTLWEIVSVNFNLFEMQLK